MPAAHTTLLTPGTNDEYTTIINNGILGAPNADYALVGGAGVTVTCDTSKCSVFRIAGTTGVTLTVALTNAVDGRDVTLYFIANSGGTMGITLPASVVHLGTPPLLTLVANAVASIRLRWDAIMNSGAGGWVEVSRTGFQPTWIAPTLGGSMTNLGSGWTNVGYKIDQQKYVEIQGMIAGAGIVNAATIFTLPVGYRPPAAHLFTTMSLNGTTPGFGNVSVAANGDVKVNSTTGTTAFSLEGIRFPAAA